VFLGRATATNAPAAGSVNTAAIAADAITEAKIADDAVTAAKLATLTSAVNFQGTASDMRLNFDTTDTVANATPLMAITAKNKTDSVAQLSMRRESAVDDGYIALSTQPTGGAVTERVRIHSNGVMSAANGIALGVGTANTSSNVLDDYEEGTWTPAATGASTAGTGVTGAGRYTKVGNLVHIDFSFVSKTISGASGDLRITGLPFTVSGADSVRGAFGGNVRFYNYNLDGNTYYQLTLVADENTSYLVVTQTRDHGTWSTLAVDNDSGLYIEGGITYTTTA
jgi:hypothetical protein